MAVEKYGSKTDVVIKLILVFFISLLSFSIGTFVGKKFSDNQHKLSSLEPSDMIDRGLASVDPDATEVTPEDALTEEEIAKLADEFVTDDEHKAPHAEEPHHNDKNTEHTTSAKADVPKAVESPKHPAPKADAHKETPKPMESAKRVSEGKSAMTETAKAELSNRIPASLPKNVAASPIGKYTVQIAAFTKEEEAQNKANELKNKGFSAFYVAANVKGKAYYRVSVGLFSTQKEAIAYKNDLMAKAKVGSALIQKISE